MLQCGHINQIPEDPLGIIFSNLEKHDLAVCSQINKHWKKIADDNELWIKVAQLYFRGEFSYAIMYRGILKQYASRIVRSNDEIIVRLQQFADRVSIGQTARFRCILGPDGQRRQYQQFEIVIKATQTPLPTQLLRFNLNQLDFTEDYMAVHDIGDGSITAPFPDRYSATSCQILRGPRRYHVVAPHPDPYLLGTLSTPESSRGTTETETPLAERMAHIILRTLTRLDAPQRCRQVLVDIIAAIGIAVILFAGVSELTSKAS